MTTTTFTTVFPGTHVTSWTDDEGFDLVTVGVPINEVSSLLWTGEYEDVLHVWDVVEGRYSPLVPRHLKPLLDALENLQDRL